MDPASRLCSRGESGFGKNPLKGLLRTGLPRLGCLGFRWLLCSRSRLRSSGRLKFPAGRSSRRPKLGPRDGPRLSGRSGVAHGVDDPRLGLHCVRNSGHADLADDHWGGRRGGRSSAHAMDHDYLDGLPPIPCGTMITPAPRSSRAPVTSGPRDGPRIPCGRSLGRSLGRSAGAVVATSVARPARWTTTIRTIGILTDADDPHHGHPGVRNLGVMAHT